MSTELQQQCFSPVPKDELMLAPLDGMKGKVNRKVHLYAAVANYYAFEKRKSGLRLLSKSHFKALCREMLATPEGYFFYINIVVGAENYARAHKVPCNHETVVHILDTFGKECMLEWINLSVA